MSYRNCWNARTLLQFINVDNNTREFVDPYIYWYTDVLSNLYIFLLVSEHI